MAQTFYPETDRAYTAGIVDGEGSIMIIRHNCSQLRVRQGYFLTLEVHITNTDKGLIEWLKSVWGGSIFEPKRVDKHKPVWTWFISSQQAIGFLQVIQPYLRLKKAQAEVALDFQSNRRRGCRKLPEERREEDLLHSAMKTLNRRGS